MPNLTKIIEEEKEAFHELHQTNLVTRKMRDDFLEQSMIKVL